MSLRAPQFQTRSGHALQSPSCVSDVDRVICLSRQKLQRERARDEPDLRKLLAHVCTFEHIQGWLYENPPCRKAPSPPQHVEVPANESDIPPCSRQVETEPPISRFWPIGDVRSTVTVVREVDSDEDSDDTDSDSSEESWDAFDTSDNAIFGKWARVKLFCERVPKLIDHRLFCRRTWNLPIGPLISSYRLPGLRP